MTWRTHEFREYFLAKVGKENSAASYASNLRKIDQFVGGLDEKIAEVGVEKVIQWAKGQSEGPFGDAYASNARSALNRYVKFLIDVSDPEASDENAIDAPALITASEATTFQYEKELQAAVRRQISTLGEPLEIADGGTERSVATGRIDVLAKDADGTFVVIELKAGTCPSGAMEQVLGYAEDLALETGQPVRAMLIAADFPERLRMASKRVNGLRLLTYKLQLAFDRLD